jgi:predicted esterase
MKHLLFFCCSFISTLSFAQNNNLNIFRITSSHTSFPDTARANGHTYNKVLYDAATHYMDSSVLIIAPKKLNANKKVDLIFWFHGWGNNIDTAASHFELIEQFAASRLNAVLVLAETTKDAPDSYGGKLEYNNTFKELVADVIQELKKEKVVSKKCEPGKIILAGHSGAYRVMAFILANGNMPVQEVILFDALYAQTDKFLNWIRSDKSHRFINIYTDGGGTDGESKEMVKELIKANINADSIEEKELTQQLVLTQRILFIHSLHKHNDIINDPDNFRLFLENTSFLKKLKE